MDERVKALALRALHRLGSTPAPSPPSPPRGGASPEEALRLSSLTLAQLSRLAYLQAGDPLVDRVLTALRSGRPVYLDRPAVERSLGLSEYPPRVREWFSRWFIRIAGLGIALVGREEEPAPSAARGERKFAAEDGRYFAAEGGRATRGGAPAPRKPEAAPAEPSESSGLTPDRQVLREILGEVAPEPHPCWLEPQKACCGSGRCKTLGF